MVRPLRQVVKNSSASSVKVWKVRLVYFNPLADRVVGRTWRTIQQRSSSSLSLLCGSPLRATVASAAQKWELWRFPSSISSVWKICHWSPFQTPQPPADCTFPGDTNSVAKDIFMDDLYGRWSKTYPQLVWLFRKYPAKVSRTYWLIMTTDISQRQSISRKHLSVAFVKHPNTFLEMFCNSTFV